MKPSKLLLLLLLLGLSALLMGLSWGEENNDFKWMTPQELKAKMDEVEAKQATPFVLIDSRNPARYAAGHLKGARLLPWKEMKESDLPADKGAMVVFYCDGPG